MKKIITICIFLIFTFAMFSQEVVFPSPYKQPVEWGRKICSGDFNGDKLVDLVILAPMVKNHTGEWMGEASVFYQKQSGFDLKSDLVLQPSLSGHSQGIANACTGDFNADGFDDLIVSNPFFGEPQLDRGFVEFFRGGKNGLSAKNKTLKTGETAYGSYGSRVECFDFNTDGIDDLMVESRFAEILEGRIYIFYGGKNFDINNPDISLRVHNSESLYFTFADDINYDGNIDIVCRTNNNWNSNVTTLAVFFGGKKTYPNADLFFKIENFTPYLFIPEKNWMLGTFVNENSKMASKIVDLNNLEPKVLSNFTGRILKFNNTWFVYNYGDNKIMFRPCSLSDAEITFLPAGNDLTFKCNFPSFFIFEINPEKNYLFLATRGDKMESVQQIVVE